MVSSTEVRLVIIPPSGLRSRWRVLLQHPFLPLDKRGATFGRLVGQRQTPDRLGSVVVKDGLQILTSLDQVARLCFPIAVANQLLKALSADVGDDLFGVAHRCDLRVSLGRLIRDGQVAPGLKKVSGTASFLLLGLPADDSAVLLEWPCQ